MKRMRHLFLKSKFNFNLAVLISNLIIFIRRAKLYTFSETLLNKGTGNKSWNDKGIGEMKLLK